MCTQNLFTCPFFNNEMKVFVALSQTKPVDTSIDLPPNKVLIPMSLKEWKVISRLGQVIKKSESFKGIE